MYISIQHIQQYNTYNNNKNILLVQEYVFEHFNKIMSKDGLIKFAHIRRKYVCNPSF